MINRILQSWFPNFYAQSNNVFYIGRKRLPISLSRDGEDYIVKLGSGFASYTLRTNKKELNDLTKFVYNYINTNL